MVRRALEELSGDEELIEPGSVVLIKPNVGFDNLTPQLRQRSWPR